MNATQIGYLSKCVERTPWLPPLSLLPHTSMATAGVARHSLVAFFKDFESAKCNHSSSNKPSLYLYHYRYEGCSLSMNGCQGEPRIPLGTIETRSFPAVSTPALAMEALNYVISDLKSNPPLFSSGIIRLQVSPCHVNFCGFLPLCHVSIRSSMTPISLDRYESELGECNRGNIA